MTLARTRADIEEVKRHQIRQLTRVYRGLVLEGHRRLVLRTPVRTGRARGNWHLTERAPAQGTRFPGGNAAAIPFAIAESVAFTRNVKAGDIVYDVNNLPYIEALEQGSSTQAPSGMVAVTANELQQIVDGLARRP